MNHTPDFWLHSNVAWVYGGIRSLGRYVGVIDTDKIVRELYLVRQNRRILRQWIREENEDTVVSLSLDFVKPPNLKYVVSKPKVK